MIESKKESEEMKKKLLDRNVRVRCKKSYPEAHTHLLVGRVLEVNSTFLMLECRTFHLQLRATVCGVVKNDRSRITAGEVMERVIPWQNVEILHLLPQETDYRADYQFDDNDNLVFADRVRTVIAYHREMETKQGGVI